VHNSQNVSPAISATPEQAPDSLSATFKELVTPLRFDQVIPLFSYFVLPLISFRFSFPPPEITCSLFSNSSFLFPLDHPFLLWKSQHFAPFNNPFSFPHRPAAAHIIIRQHRHFNVFQFLRTVFKTLPPIDVCSRNTPLFGMSKISFSERSRPIFPNNPTPCHIPFLSSTKPPNPFFESCWKAADFYGMFIAFVLDLDVNFPLDSSLILRRLVKLCIASCFTKSSPPRPPSNDPSPDARNFLSVDANLQTC